MNYLSLVPGGRDFGLLLATEMGFLSTLKREDKELHLGRLSCKEEAAGKIRVFAITDSITQCVLSPLSDGIFEILRNLPMDGTFDQDRPVRHLKQIFALNDDRIFYSYDLSAATDRLPITIQIQVLACLIGSKAAKS